MARGDTLGELVERLRAECRITTSVAQGQANENYLKQLIRRYYEQLYDDYDWPFARIQKSVARKTIAAGSRYYDFATTIDVERIERLYYLDGSQWRKMSRGINPFDYSVHDSDGNERADPILKWDIYTASQFEVWPLPASAGTVWVDGIKKKNALTANEDTCDLDGNMIVLFAAAEVLAATNQKDSQTKLQAAQGRRDQLRGKLAGSEDDFVMGGETDNQTRRPPEVSVVATTS